LGEPNTMMSYLNKSSSWFDCWASQVSLGEINLIENLRALVIGQVIPTWQVIFVWQEVCYEKKSQWCNCWMKTLVIRKLKVVSVIMPLVR